MTSYHATKDWSRIVREDDPEAAFVVAPADIDRLGLREALDAFLAPPAPARPADKRRRFPDPSPSREAPPPGDNR